MNKKVSVVCFIPLILMSSILPSLFPKYYLYIQIPAILLLSFSVYFTIYFIVKLLTRSNKHPIKIRVTYSDIIVCALALYVCAQYFLSPQTRLSPEKLIIYMSVFCTYFYIRSQVGTNDRKTKNLILYTIIIFGSMQALYALLQWFKIVPNLFGCYKFGGTYGNPGDLANVLCISYALSLDSFDRENKPYIRWGLLGVILLHLIIIISSEARTAWIAVFFISAYTVKNSLIKEFLKLKKRVSPVIIFTLIAVLITIGGFISTKLYTFKHDSSSGRLFIWKQCIELVKEKPLFGHGYDSFFHTYFTNQAHYFMHNPDDIDNGMLADEIIFAYNDFLQYAIEYGLLGIGLLALLLLGVLNEKNISVFSNRQFTNKIQSAIIGIMVCMLFSYPLQNTSILLIIAILVAIHNSSIGMPVKTYQISNKKIKTYYIVPVAIYLTLGAIGVVNISYCYSWKKVTEMHISKKIDPRDNYKQLFKTLKHNKAFLYSYGVALYQLGEYETCIKHFEQYYNYCLNINMLMKLASCYNQINDYTNAEKYYKLASYVKPHLFVPKYQLFCLYKSTKQQVKAKELAFIIKEMDVKVFSRTVRDIKSRVNQFLLDDQ